MADYHETVLSPLAFEELLALEDVAAWRSQVEELSQKNALKASSVHTRAGDVVDPLRRLSFGRPGRSERVFDFIDASILKEVCDKLEGTLAVYRGHYDLVYYAPGGFFSKHVDHVNAYGPGLCCWHALVCLDAEGCEGGRTLVHADAAHASSASVTPGACLLIRNGVPHEGLKVESGRKVLLKFELFQFEARKAMRGLKAEEEMVPCLCADGVVDVERRFLLRQPFFERLVAFEGAREEMKLGGVAVSECRALRLFLAGDETLSRSPEDLLNAHEVLHYISAPEAALTVSELACLCAREVVVTSDRRTARRLATLAGEDYVFFGVVQSWSVNVKDIWDICLDLCRTETFTSNLCVVSSGHVVLTTSPGPRWHKKDEHGRISLPELNRQVRLFAADSEEARDTFETMDALLERQVCASSVDHWNIAERGESGEASPRRASPPPASLDVADGVKLARLLVRRTSRMDFRKILEACAGTARFRHEVVEDACNDGESFFTTTMYESRVYEFEWALCTKAFLEAPLRPSPSLKRDA
jgi:hypothetical protein